MWQQVRQEWHAAANWLDDSWRQAGIWLRNQLRDLQGAQVDFVVIPLEGSLPERSAPPRPFWQRQLGLYHDPLSFQELNHIVQRIVDADNVTGVLFIFQGLSTGFATLQNFRQTVQRLKDAGKKVVIYTPYLDLPHYYAATSADLIVAPPSASFEVLGVHSSITFLKDSLAMAGVQFDVIQISPFKSAYDSLGKSEMSPELEQQINWLLDEQFDLLTTGMATGRGLTTERLRELIDQAPLFDEALCQHNLVDALLYEDELAYWLAENVREGTGESEQLAVSSEQLLVSSESSSSFTIHHSQFTIHNSFPYFLYVGTLQPRKNLSRLVEAYAQSGVSHHLVLAGRVGWLADDLLRTIARQPAEIRGRIHIPGYISDQDKTRLLRGATALIFPSLYEGFGFPVLEAQAVGTPVLCANSSSLPEVAGDSALLVNPLQVGEIAAAIQRLTQDTALCQELSHKGYANVRRFTWENAAAQVLSLISNL